jgi:hypothetical protein
VEEEKAALELAIAVGRRAAIRQLGISSATFQKWTEKHAQYWSDLRANDPEAQEKRYVQRLEDVAENALSVEHKAIERAESLIDGASAKDLSGLMKAITGSRATASAGVRAAKNEPDRVEHTINFPALEQAMERLLDQGGPSLPALPVENEAETVGD